MRVELLSTACLGPTSWLAEKAHGLIAVILQRMLSARTPAGSSRSGVLIFILESWVTEMILERQIFELRAVICEAYNQSFTLFLVRARNNGSYFYVGR